MNAHNRPAINESDYVKSSRCVWPPGGCVEVAIKGDMVAVRDAKDTTQAPLVFTKQEWEAFVKGVKLGEFDHR